MNAFRKTIPPLLLSAALLLGCRAAAGEPTATPPEPDAVLTSAAQTAEARLTEAAAAPSPTEPAPTATATTAITPTAGVTPIITGTVAGATPTATTALVTPAPGGPDQAQFVSDVTVPDGTSYAPGTDFTKTWRLQNAGTTTWTTEYDLVFAGGDQMGGASSTPLSQSVAPGETIDVSVDLTAPDTAGTKTGFWILSNAQGQTFQTSFFVQINVTGAGTQVSDNTATPTATSAPGDDVVTSVTLTVENPDFTGACPHTFNLTGQVTLSEGAQVTLELEAGADGAYTFDLPGPETLNLGAGVSTFSYTLTLEDTVTGWAALHVTAPEDVTSGQARFTLTCE